MAMVPELTSHDNSRVVLNSARYAGTVLSNVLVFGTMVAILGAEPRPDVDAGQTGESNPENYAKLAYVVLGVGALCSILCLAGTAEAVPGAPPPGPAFMELGGEEEGGGGGQRR